MDINKKSSLGAQVRARAAISNSGSAGNAPAQALGQGARLTMPPGGTKHISASSPSTKPDMTARPELAIRNRILTIKLPNLPPTILVARLINTHKGLVDDMLDFANAALDESGGKRSGLKEESLFRLLTDSTKNPDAQSTLDFLKAGRHFADASRLVQGSHLNAVIEVAQEMTSMLEATPFKEILAHKAGFDACGEILMHSKSDTADLDKQIVEWLKDTSQAGTRKAAEIVDFLLAFKEAPKPSQPSLAACWNAAHYALEKWENYHEF